jgi:predicted metal-dependent hydrolase
VVVEYAGERIPVALERKERQRLSITVHPDRSVTASAPKDRPLADVLAHMQRHRRWIVRQRRHFEKYQPLPTPRHYVSGETHLYLGRQYRLKVGRGAKAEAKLAGRFLHVWVPNPQTPRAVRGVLEEWYRKHAAIFFARQMACCAKKLEALGDREPRYRLRRMSSRWASCSRSGAILINPELIKAPAHCIDYVLVHELCHLVEPNHGPRFYRLLSRCLPDWQARKARLDAVIPP